MDGSNRLISPEISEEFDFQGFVKNYGDDVVAVRLIFNSERAPIRVSGACDLAALA